MSPPIFRPFLRLQSTLRQNRSQYMTRSFTPSRWNSTSSPAQSPSHPSQNLHTNFYRTHGRALFKSLTMAFLSYQIFYWAWTVLETESIKDEKNKTIRSLEEEVRLLGSGVGSHGGQSRLLEEPAEKYSNIK